MLVELGLVEQRHKAVLEVLAGATITDVAQRNGVTRQTVHRWLRRYASVGLAGLADHSSRPASCPHQMSPETEVRLLELREEHPSWGPRSLRHQLQKEDVFPLPGRSSIYRCLVRHGLIGPQKRRRKREDHRRWERSRSMELWQMDIMGGVRLRSGAELKIITGLDDYSRFCVSAPLVPRATARPVCEALATMRRYGVPDHPALLHPVVHRSEQYQADQAVLRSRQALVRTRASLITHARGMVKIFGAKLPHCSTDAFVRM